MTLLKSLTFFNKSQTIDIKPWLENINHYVTDKEVNQYKRFKNLKLPYSAETEYFMSLIFKRMEDIQLIHEDKMFTNYYFNDNLRIMYRNIQHYQLKASEGYVYHDFKEIYKWKNNQPSMAILCALEKLEKNNDFEKINWNLNLFTLNHDLDEVLNFIMNHPEEMLMMSKVERNKKYYIDIQLTKNTVVSLLTNTDYIVKTGGLAACGCLSINNEVIFEWNEASPNPRTYHNLYQFLLINSYGGEVIFDKNSNTYIRHYKKI